MYIVFATWLVVGIFGGPLIYLILPVTMLLLAKKDLYEELFIGYLFILVLSDSSVEGLNFAKSIKNIYISVLAVLILLNSSKFYPYNKLYKGFIPFFIISVITVMLSINESFFTTSLQKTFSYIISFLVIPNLVSKLYREEGEQFLRRFVFFIVSVLIIGLSLKFFAPDIATLKGERFRGVFGGPNGLGVYCVLTFIIYFVLNSYFPKLFSKIERQVILFALLLSIYLCGSRNALISVLVFYIFQRFFSVSLFLGIIIFIATIFIVELTSSYATSLIITLGLENYFRIQTLEEGSGRYIAWDFAWKQIQNNFFLGKGFAYNEFYMRKHYGMLLKLNHQGGIHNSFLTFWMDQGLIGLLAYLGSFVMLFVKASRRTKYAIPIMFAISFSAFFESWLVGSLSAFAFLGMFIFSLITSDEIHDRVEFLKKNPENEDKILAPVIQSNNAM
jgi:O-antigen ligase